MLKIKEWIKVTHQWWVDKVWKPSWTRFVATIYGVPAAVVVIVEQVGAWASSDTVKSLVDQLHVPGWVPQTLVLIALVHYMAHGRDN